MRILLKILILLQAMFLFVQCEKSEPEPNENWVAGCKWTDLRDGNTYATVPIGDQVWMMENMAYLPSVNMLQEGSEDEGKKNDPFYYVYNYDGTDVSAAKTTSEYQLYGVLYNWTAAMDACPDGWHLPSDSEWMNLEIHIGMTSTEAMKEGLRGTDEEYRHSSDDR